jgi:hypothetical protein
VRTMEKLTDGKPGLHESWRELAEHSLTHDDLQTSNDRSDDSNAESGKSDTR